METKEAKINALREAVSQAKKAVFFGGAGVSTESGLPDFRGANGLYRQNYEFTPESYFSRRFLDWNPEEFFRFQRERLLKMNAEPNTTHKKLAELEQRGILQAVITQNVDGLHQAAGSKNVIELHGNMQHCHCMRCRKSYKMSVITETEGVPRCKICRGVIRPDVVLYGERPDKRKLEKAIRCIREADLMIVGGTSLVVNPAVSLVHEFRGQTLAIINLGLTPMDGRADIVIHEQIGTVFAAL